MRVLEVIKPPQDRLFHVANLSHQAPEPRSAFRFQPRSSAARFSSQRLVSLVSLGSFPIIDATVLIVVEGSNKTHQGLKPVFNRVLGLFSENELHAITVVSCDQQNVRAFEFKPFKSRVCVSACLCVCVCARVCLAQIQIAFLFLGERQFECKRIS